MGSKERGRKRRKETGGRDPFSSQPINWQNAHLIIKTKNPTQESCEVMSLSSLSVNVFQCSQYYLQVIAEMQSPGLSSVVLHQIH